LLASGCGTMIQEDYHYRPLQGRSDLHATHHSSEGPNRPRGAERGGTEQRGAERRPRATRRRAKERRRGAGSRKTENASAVRTPGAAHDLVPAALPGSKGWSTPPPARAGRFPGKRENHCAFTPRAHSSKRW